MAKKKGRDALEKELAEAKKTRDSASKRIASIEEKLKEADPPEGGGPGCGKPLMRSKPARQ